MRVLVLGGYGAVGRHLVATLRHDGHTVLAVGRDAARSDEVVNRAESPLATYREVLSDSDVVVNASGVENPRLAELAGASDRAFIDISATVGYLDQLRQLPPRAPIIIDVGLAPGLTNLLAVTVHAQAPGPVDIAVLLGAGERHGAAATEWTYRLLGTHFDADGQRIRNYTRPEKFTLPGYRRPRRLVRLNFSDQHTLRRELNVPVRTFFGVDSRLAGAALAALTWLPGASHAPRGLHLPGTDRWIVLARGHDGTTCWAHGRNQSRATATIAAAAIRKFRHTPGGVQPVHHILTLHDLPTEEITLNVPA